MLSRQVAAVRGRLVAPVRRATVVGLPLPDVALAALFLAMTLLDLTFPHGDDGYVGGPAALNVPLALLLPLPLATRRRAPLASYAVSLVSVMLPNLVVAHTMYFWAGFLPLLILVYSVGRYVPRRTEVVAGTGVLLALVLDLHHPDARGIAAVLFDGILCAAAWFVGRTVRRFVDQGEALAATLAELDAERAAAEDVAVTAERRRIAAEMHDVVAHAVSLMVVQVGATRMELERGGTKQPGLLTAEEIGREALVELRRTLGVLRTESGPERQPLPGLDAAPALVDALREAGMDVEFDLGDLGPLPAAAQLTAFRILQEALTNAVRHGSRRTVTASVRRANDSLVLDVSNPVTGRSSRRSSAESAGLTGMRQRVAMFRGTLTAGRRDDRFEVHAVLPLATAGASADQPGHEQPAGVPL